MLALALAMLLAHGSTQDALPIPEDLQKEVARAEHVGQAIYDSDQASWHATDALAASKGPLEKLELGGFLAVQDAGGSWQVLFLTREDHPRVLQRVAIDSAKSKPRVLDTPAPIPLSKEDAALWAARTLAIESCGPYEQPLNPVVLRGSAFGESGILVYLLAGTDKPDVAVLGRHTRVRVSDDGAKVLEQLPLVKGVIESPMKTKDGKPVSALIASQVVTDFPTEVQVFAQLNAGLPLYVATRRGLWMLDEGKIVYLGEKPPEKATLHLALRERTSGEPREGQVVLWRIGMPAEKGWTAGDERIGKYSIPKDGLDVPDLVPGTYRAASEAHACTAADLPAFELKGPRSDVVLDVEAPQEREVWVEIFDARGQIFEKAEYDPGSRQGSSRPPGWLHLRDQIGLNGSMGGSTDYTRSMSDHPTRKLVHGAHGFSLGREREDGGIYKTSRAFRLRIPDHGDVGGTLSFDGHDELRYRAVLIEKGSFEGLFTLPDGSELNLARLSVETPLELDVQPRPAEWWLDVPVRIAANAPGCKRLELQFRLRDGLPKPRTLEKAP